MNWLSKLFGPREPGDKIWRPALDGVEPGEENGRLYDLKHADRNKLPDGVTSQKLTADVVHIAGPALAELLLTQLASMVDLMMVGRLGAYAVSSVGLSTQPKLLMMSAFMAMNVGTMALVAQSRGACQKEEAEKFLRQGLLLSLLLGAGASVLGTFFAGDMIRLMGAGDAETIAGGTAYLKIQMMGIFGLALTMTVSAALRGVGETKITMLYNLVNNIVNVIFNYFLIFGNCGFPRLGVAGASLATVLGQFVALGMAFGVVLRGKRYLHLRLTDSFVPDFHAFGRIFNIGLPAVVEQLAMRFGIIVYTRTVASLGTVAFATHQIVINVQALSFMNGQGFSIAATPLVGQSLGKRRPDMAHLYTQRTRRVGLITACAIAATLILFGRQIVGCYNGDAEIVRMGAMGLAIIALIQPMQSSQLIITGTLRGAGDTRTPAMIAFLTAMILRPLLGLYMVLGLHWGLVGAWIAFVADQAMRSLLVYIRFRSGKWKLLKI